MPFCHSPYLSLSKSSTQLSALTVVPSWPGCAADWQTIWLTYGRKLSGKLVGFYWPLNVRLRKSISIYPEGNEEALKVFELLGSVRLWETRRRFSWPIRNVQKGHNNPKSQGLRRPRLILRLVDNRPPRLMKLVTAGTSTGFFSSTEQCPRLPWPSQAWLHKGLQAKEAGDVLEARGVRCPAWGFQREKNPRLTLGWGTGCF